MQPQMFSYLVLLLVVYCNAEKFCATLTPNQAAGASGFVAMDIQEGDFILNRTFLFFNVLIFRVGICEHQPGFDQLRAPSCMREH